MTLLSFPYYDDDPDYYENLTSSYYKFWLHDSVVCVGWILPWVVTMMPWEVNFWTINHEERTLTPLEFAANFSSNSDIIAHTLHEARKEKTFQVLRGWRDELYPIHGSISDPASIERAGSALFGIVTFGVHLTAYVEGKDGIQIWVPRRARDKATYPGMLDNTVAGGMTFGEEPFESIVREAVEEASLPEALVRSQTQACGTVSYFYIQNTRPGEESGLLQPSIRYVYDLKLDSWLLPTPGDSEVEDFSLWSLPALQKAVAEGLFRPSSTLVLLDFFIRHGILTAENEDDYAEIVSKIHRRLPFPTSSQIIPTSPTIKPTPSSTATKKKATTPSALKKKASPNTWDVTKAIKFAPLPSTTPTKPEPLPTPPTLRPRRGRPPKAPQAATEPETKPKKTRANKSTKRPAPEESDNASSPHKAPATKKKRKQKQ